MTLSLFSLILAYLIICGPIAAVLLYVLRRAIRAGYGKALLTLLVLGPTVGGAALLFAALRRRLPPPPVSH